MTLRARAVRRRSRTPFVVHVRTFWVVGLLALALVGALAVALIDAPQLRVRSVEATVPADSPVRSFDVLAAAHVDVGANLWLLDTGSMRRRIEALPYVREARIHRAQFPVPSIAFAVSVRVPTGCVRAAATVVTIDAAARVLQRGCASPALPLVDAGNVAAPPAGATLTAPDIDRLLADAKQIGDKVPVRIVRRDRFGGLEAVDTGGVILRFGSDDDLATKLALVDPIRRSTAGTKKLRAIDLRAPATPVVEFP